METNIYTQKGTLTKENCTSDINKNKALRKHLGSPTQTLTQPTPNYIINRLRTGHTYKRNF